jgi:hypothetical protein
MKLPVDNFAMLAKHSASPCRIVAHADEVIE